MREAHRKEGHEPKADDRLSQYKHGEIRDAQPRNTTHVKKGQVQRKER